MRLYSIITHIAGWILFLSLPILFVGNQSGGSDFWSILFSWNALLFFTTYVSIFYLNSYFLIPQLYAKKRWLLYALSIVVLLAGILALRPYDSLINKMPNRFSGNPDQYPPPGRFKPTDRPFREPGYDEPDEPPPGSPGPHGSTDR